MRKLSILALLATAACGAQSPMVRSEDLSKHLESIGYTKVTIREGFSCGKMGKGRGFLAVNKKGDTVAGQVCFKKDKGAVIYVVDEKKVLKKAKT